MLMSTDDVRETDGYLHTHTTGSTQNDLTAHSERGVLGGRVGRVYDYCSIM